MIMQVFGLWIVHFWELTVLWEAPLDEIFEKLHKFSKLAVEAKSNGVCGEV